ncbi:hypothetical protein BDR04DRAFT_469209 [Suillus decipiens]|nr:hypothetical protein BDR04DRAFT_469209 [Suillus decipiens]
MSGSVNGRMLIRCQCFSDGVQPDSCRARHQYYLEFFPDFRGFSLLYEVARSMFLGHLFYHNKTLNSHHHPLLLTGLKAYSHDVTLGPTVIEVLYVPGKRVCFFFLLAVQHHLTLPEKRRRIQLSSKISNPSGIRSPKPNVIQQPIGATVSFSETLELVSNTSPHALTGSM